MFYIINKNKYWRTQGGRGGRAAAPPPPNQNLYP